MARRRRPGGYQGRRGGARRRRGPTTVEERRVGPPAGSEIELPETIGVQDLADRLGLSGIEVIKQLMRDGVMANVTQMMDYETASMVVTDLGFRPKESEEVAGEVAARRPDRDPAAAEEALEPRPPVVTILGHVDHGKTTLLDTIRKSKVVEGEQGGITQHIGAYQVEVQGKKITFLDTPGHAAFTAMRARGAQVTDIAVLVVAADDGVMPQTVEAMDHVRAAGVPVVVAISKVDQPNANVDRAKTQLSERGLLLEEWGGDVIAVPLSAKTGEGVEALLENVLLVAEVGDLKAEPERLATGVVVEARVDRARGPVATVLVHNGTLHTGDPIVAGESWGRVRAMQDDAGRRVPEAGPSQPVEVLGLAKLPRAGDPVEAFSDDKQAKAFVEERERRRERSVLGGGVRGGEGSMVVRAPSLDSFTAEVKAGQSGGGEVVKELPVIVKTDVQGSVEPVRESLERLNREGARVRVLHAAAGSINEGDILLAVASSAMIIGFNSEPEPGARSMAQIEGVEIRSYGVIYTLVDEVNKALEGVLEPVAREVVEGHAEVRTVFSVGRRVKIAGAYMTDGRVGRNSRAKVLRGGNLICEGTVSSLKRFKDDAREVTSGFECGIGIDGCSNFQEGDTFEFSHTELSRP